MLEKQNYEPIHLPKRTVREWLKNKLIVDAENVMRLIYPLVRYIHEKRPDYLLALDSGARITSLAILALYSELYGELPTKDHAIHFKKVSHKFTPALIKHQLEGCVQQALSANESPLLFVIDDCTNTGITASRVRRAVSELSNGKVRLRFGVMREFLAGITDVKGDTFSLARPAWRNQPELIGVYYSDNTIPHVLSTQEAISLREQIRSSAKQFAAKIKGGVKNEC